MARHKKSRQISVRQELVFGFTAILLLLIFVSGIALYSQQRSVNAVDKLIYRDTELSELALKSNNALFKARRYEKDFYLNFHEIGFAEAKARYVTLYRTQLTQIRSNLREIRSLDTSSATGESTRQIEEILGKYENGFLTAVDFYANLGHVQNGLEGLFREKIRALEAEILAVGSDRLMVELLTIRRHEKDYLIRGVQIKAQEVRDATTRLRANIETAPLPTVQRERITQLAASYLELFNAFVATWEKIGSAKTEYLNAVHTVEPLLENLYLGAIQGAENTRANVHREADLTSHTVILASAAAMLIGALVAYLVARHIARSVQASMSFAEKIASGNLESHIEPPNQKEFAALADALNVMANALRASRAAQESKAAELEVRVIDRTQELAGANSLLKAEIETRRQTESELYQAKEIAEAATRSKSEFLANMSHEIRTPMNGVIGLTSLVLKTSLSHQQQDYMRLIQSSADSLLRLLNDILDFSKMEARKLELDIIEFDLRESIGNTLKGFASNANEKGVELTYHVARDVPNLLVGDPGRLTQIIVNLVGNALKFTQRGEVVLRVTQELASSAASLLHISISDTGIGISTAQQEYIFNAFAQADSSTTRQYGGTGLGLAIVSQLVMLMGGRIWVESEPGKGTTFHLTARFGLSPNASVATLPQESILLQNMPVLIVDDNHSNRLILGDILTSWNMQASLAESADAAMAALVQQSRNGTPFSLVLIDSHMPQFDSFQLAEAIRSSADLSATTVMMLASNDIAGELARCNAIGITQFLKKPVKPSELFNVIMTATGLMPAERTRMTTESGTSSSKPARALHVLVAEDHPINQRLVAEILMERGHTFMMASNGIEALALLDRHRFDVILMDGQMPEMDGYQATREIRRREQLTGQHIRIIAVTAHAMTQDRDVCLAAGMDDYLSKPIDADRLIERLEYDLSNAHAGSIDIVNAAPQSGSGNTDVMALPAPTAIPSDTPSAAQADTLQSAKAFDRDSALKRARGKRPLLINLIHAFLQDLPTARNSISTAIEADDWVTLERTAHRLHGAAATLSATPLAEAAAKLEHIGQRKSLEEVQHAASFLELCADELIVEFNAELVRLETV